MFRVFIENEAGASIKNTFNEKTLEFRFSEPVSDSYPYPYGFILDTTSGDGDNVDCFVITHQSLRGGEVLECEAIGLLPLLHNGEIDNKILGVLCGEDVLLDDKVVKRIQNFLMKVFEHIPDTRMEIGELMDKTIAERYIQKSLD